MVQFQHLLQFIQGIAWRAYSWISFLVVFASEIYNLAKDHYKPASNDWVIIDMWPWGWIVVVVLFFWAAFQTYADAARIAFKKVDWDSWDKVNEFQIRQAACLLYGIDPVLPLPLGAKRQYRSLQRAIKKRIILAKSSTSRESLELATKIVKQDSSPHIVDQFKVITREQLLIYSKKNCLKPKLLFPEERL